MKQTTLQPQDIAFNKLYFVNLFAPNTDKEKTFQDAKFHYPRLAAIAEKLTGTELEFLIGKIEGIS